MWARAALLIHPKGAFVSHRSAAAIYGVPVPPHSEVDVSVVRAADRRFAAGIRPHVAHHDEDVVERRGVRISSPYRMFAELARLCAPEQLRRYCRQWTGYCRRQAIRAATLVRDGVDSAMETRLRLLLVLAGLPEPEINHKLRWPDGSVRRRLDLSYPSVHLIIEYDGRHHALDTVQWRSDLERREEFDDEGWRLLVVTNEGLYDQPLRTLVRVRNALVERGYPGVPGQFDDVWTAHFTAN
jgi:hypothetical protein